MCLCYFRACCYVGDGGQPEKADKEPIRHYYQQYNEVKMLIEKKSRELVRLLFCVFMLCTLVATVLCFVVFCCIVL